MKFSLRYETRVLTSSWYGFANLRENLGENGENIGWKDFDCHYSPATFYLLG
jgi:hypothetical protein